MDQKFQFSIKKIIHYILPPPRWQFTVIISTGIIFGLALYILFIANAVSYLSDNPSACINCHVMFPQYATWQRSSHGRVATCNDCHVPQNNIIRKYLFKSSDGLRHSTMFTFRLEPQVIRIKEAGASVVQENCIRCHQNIVHNISIKQVTFENYSKGEGLVCWSCHREVPHGRVNSLASVPYARIPEVSTNIPEWINKINIEKKTFQNKKEIR